MIGKARTLLKNIFGYQDFRPLQEDIIKHLLAGNDTLVIMPTGGGKSLCYQLPALVYGGMTIVVSPLISLMKDQVEQLHEDGVRAVCLNSSLDNDEYRKNIHDIKQGSIKLLYVAPETLLMPATMKLLDGIIINCLAIDEAHCISEWGHDFRPEYRKIATVRKHFPNAVCMALTATATPRVQEDIKNNLGFDDSDAFIASFNRENLFLEIVPKTNAYSQIIRFLEKYPDQSGIIYCFSRKQVDELAIDLETDGYSVKPYHAGLDDKIRHTNQELFIKDDVRIIIATIAFGMGINKPNVRFVIHHDLPKNIESYYQQIGRAGRDGLRAHCLLLFSYGDSQKINYFIEQMNPQEQIIARVHLDKLIGLAETDECRRIPLLSYFGDIDLVDNCGMCDNCTTPAQEKIDITVQMQMFLSCVKRTGELFGVHHIVDVLRGSESIKVIKFDHQKLSVHGIGKHISKKQWLHLSRQFLSKGLIEKEAMHGSIKVTQKGNEILVNRDVLMGTLALDKTPLVRAARLTEAEYDSELFSRLRMWRKQIADKTGVPPYVIFSDKSLVQMATCFPENSDELLQIHGVGSVKNKKYGASLLKIINVKK
ncbi:DNA helicase RecQ [bacterium]|nr:DNA helicase RecQ [bacterium]